MKDSLIEKMEYYSNLFDYYGKLLTEKQQKYFQDYYFYDLSLAEIAENNNISRSAVFDAIDKIHKLLEFYEKNLNLHNKEEQRNKLYEKYEQSNDTLVQELINKLKEIE